jgi:hypothetical protein
MPLLNFHITEMVSVKSENGDFFSLSHKSATRRVSLWSPGGARIVVDTICALRNYYLQVALQSKWVRRNQPLE